MKRNKTNMSAPAFETEPMAHHNPEQHEIHPNISAAEQLYRALDAGKNPDSDIADLLRDSSEHGELDDRIVADEVGGLALAEHATTTDEIPLLLANQPIGELGAALYAIGENPRYGQEAIEDITAQLERVEQEFRNRPDHQDTGNTQYEPPIENSSSPSVLKNRDSASWNKLSVLTSEIKPYTNKNAHVRRIPTSLPMSGQANYEVGSVRYAEGEDMIDALELYGVNKSVIEQATGDGGSIEVGLLPSELQHTLLTANLYEAMTRSKDPEIKQQASERNSHITVEDIWQPDTLHHVTKANKLAEILQNGHLGIKLNENEDGAINMGGESSGNINFGQFTHEVSFDASHKQKVEALSYNNRGDVYIHYTRPEGCYREEEEYETSENTKLISGGMPSTEISALTLRGGNQLALSESTRDAVVEGGFYIPIFDIDGELVYSKADFDSDTAAKKSGTYTSNEKRRDSEHSRAQTEASDREQQRLEQQAAEKGMSVEQYQQWKTEQPITRPPM